MSRGLGKLQRDILDHLDVAKQEHAEERFSYTGGASARNGLIAMWQRMRPDTPELRDLPPGQLVRSGGQDCRLGEGVYDLRATLVSLAIARGMAMQNPDRVAHASGPWWEVRHKFRSAFSRAVRGLIARGHLQRCDPWPVGREGREEIRFVSKAAPRISLVRRSPDISPEPTRSAKHLSPGLSPEGPERSGGRRSR